MKQSNFAKIATFALGRFARKTCLKSEMGKDVLRAVIVGAVVGFLLLGGGYFFATYRAFGGSLARSVLLPALLGACGGGLLGHAWGERKAKRAQQNDSEGEAVGMHQEKENGGFTPGGSGSNQGAE
jgi:hypothetical protein